MIFAMPKQLFYRQKTALLAIFLAVSLLCPARAKNQIELHPSNPQQNRAAELFMQGTRLLKSDKLLQARQCFEEARTLWPESAYIHYNLGCCYVQRGEYDLALSAFQDALNIDPKMTDAVGNIATCYQSLGRLPEAIKW